MPSKKKSHRTTAKEDFSNRTIFLFGSIEEETAQSCIAKLFDLYETSKKSILMVINSGGGCLHSMYSIHDALALIPCPINTLILGKACSASAILAISTRGHRYITPSSTMLLHDIFSAYRGSLGEVKSKVLRGEMLQGMIERSVLENSKLNRRQMRRFMQEEKTIDAQNALKFGLVDSVVESYEEIQ